MNAVHSPLSVDQELLDAISRASKDLVPAFSPLSSEDSPQGDGIDRTLDFVWVRGFPLTNADTEPRLGAYLASVTVDVRVAPDGRPSVELRDPVVRLLHGLAFVAITRKRVLLKFDGGKFEYCGRGIHENASIIASINGSAVQDGRVRTEKRALRSFEWIG